ncbi:MAG: phage tail tube protein [Bacteroidales bacterium]|nr:phage tail tube protein [Bacteroidales bacterium]
MANQIMFAGDAVSAPKGECFITIGDKRYNFMSCINIEAKMIKNKTEIPILGNVSKGNKSTGCTYEGSATFHYNTSIFRELLYEYKENGKDVYFDMQCTNEDPTSSVGRQTIILKNVNINEGLLVKLDADGDYLEDTFDFTFEDWEIPEKFTKLEGMEV